MQLPFTVVFEPPRLVARTRWFWVLGPGLAAVAALAFLFLHFLHLRPPGGTGPEVAGATLRVESEPPGAAVEIDGRARGHTPVEVPAAPGEHRVVLRLRGYADAAYPVRVDAVQTASLAGELWLRSPEAWRLRPVFPGATIADATFLGDGRLALTVALPPGDERQLWLVDGRGGARRLGRWPARGAVAASPDGTRVAYLAAGDGSATSGAADELWLAGHDGTRGSRLFALSAGDERLIDLSWAPDARRLLLLSRQQLAAGAQRTRVRLLDAATGETRELASVPSAVVPGSYAWSPDGARFALLTQVGQLTSLCLLGTDGEFRYLADLSRDDPTPLPFSPVAWSRDGARLLYAAPAQDRPAANGWLFGAKPSTALFAAEAAQPLPRSVPGASGQAPVWRPDGSILVLARGQGGNLVLRQVETGAELRDVAELPVHAGSAFAARWDPARAQAIVAVPGAATLGAAQPDYWLVRFRPEAAR